MPKIYLTDRSIFNCSANLNIIILQETDERETKFLVNVICLLKQILADTLTLVYIHFDLQTSIGWALVCETVFIQIDCSSQWGLLLLKEQFQCFILLPRRESGENIVYWTGGYSQVLVLQRGGGYVPDYFMATCSDFLEI